MVFILKGVILSPGPWYGVKARKSPEVDFHGTSAIGPTDLCECRLLKHEGSDPWESSDSFGTDDLLLLAKVADQAHTRIMQHQGNDY